MRITKRSAGLAAVAAATATVTLLATATTTEAAPSHHRIGHAKFQEKAMSGAVTGVPTTIPSWTSSFTDPTNGQNYSYTMVGTNPTSNASTTIPTVIIPINFTFANGIVLNGSDRVPATVASPMFQNADIGAAADAKGSASAPPAGVVSAHRTVKEPSDVTQVGDAIYRAQFGKTGTGWHVRLGAPQVQAPANISVTQNQADAFFDTFSNSNVALMDEQFFNQQIKNLLSARSPDPHALTIFLVNNTFLYQGTEDNCCVLGYHSAVASNTQGGGSQVNTYMFAAYSDPGIFSPNDGDTESYISDIHGLSHEVQEWYDDPFINNVVNPWLTPTAPQYGCTRLLETGDPVVGYGFKIPMSNGITYHPEDEVHFSWFARQTPSIAAQHYFTYLNNFGQQAQGC
jgi:hypothetical protein